MTKWIILGIPEHLTACPHPENNGPCAGLMKAETNDFGVHIRVGETCSGGGFELETQVRGAGFCHRQRDLQVCKDREILS